MPPVKAGSVPSLAGELDLSADWKVHFLRQDRTVDYRTLHSWTNDESTLYFSGQAEYAKTVELPQSFFARDSSVHLDFGRGTPFERQGQDESEMIALLDSPVREAAEIVVNGKSAGFVWHPPYELDVTRYLHAGTNRLRILVGNLATNEMAGRAAPTIACSTSSTENDLGRRIWTIFDRCPRGSSGGFVSRRTDRDEIER